MTVRKNLQVLAFIASVIAVQLATAATDTAHYLTQLTMSGYYSLVIIGLCVLVGYAGQISLGHAGFFAIGGYLSAFLTTYDFLPLKGVPVVSALKDAGMLIVRQDLYGGEVLSLHPWPASAVAILAAILVAYVVGGPVLKLKGHYLAMATLGVGIIVYRIALGTELLGAADGLSDIPGFPLFLGIEVSGRSSVRIQNYYIAWGLVIFCVTLLLNLIHSRIGRALRSIHAAEDAANAMGINTAAQKLKVFMLSAALAAIGGVFLTHYNGGIGPSEASVMKSVRYMAIVAIGGMANLWGALTMGLVLNFLSLRGYFGSYDDAVFGLILIVIMLFTPAGLLRRDLFHDVRSFFFSRTQGGAKQ